MTQTTLPAAPRVQYTPDFEEFPGLARITAATLAEAVVEAGIMPIACHDHFTTGFEIDPLTEPITRLTDLVLVKADRHFRIPKVGERDEIGEWLREHAAAAVGLRDLLTFARGTRASSFALDIRIVATRCAPRPTTLYHGKQMMPVLERLGIGFWCIGFSQEDIALRTGTHILGCPVIR